jgi:hypothetical protein
MLYDAIEQLFDSENSNTFLLEQRVKDIEKLAYERGRASLPLEEAVAVMHEVPDAPEPDACRNCVNLSWGTEQGWDRCRKHGHDIGWEIKANRICGNHKRSTADDPRNVK